jgi:hypothetical protein
MRRVALAGVLVGVVVRLAAPSAAWGDTIIPMCTLAHGPAEPCQSAWYTTPVFLSWTWSPLTSGTGTCQGAPHGSDAIITLSCTVGWTDGFVGTQYYTLHVETSSPTATAAPSRPPDSGGWYNHPVPAAVSASSFSGIVSCTSTTYEGPPSLGATVFGTCLDNAGKTVSVVSTPFAYDTTLPSLAVSATAGDRSVVLSWQTGGDIAPIASVAITRSRGVATQTVYSGTASGFRDTGLRNGVPYRYMITALDQAGNASTQALTVTPGPRLLTPAPGADLNAPPLLSWTPILGATYYNVQLYRGRGHKVLSVWPKQASLQLRPTWRFDGRRYHLKPGRYRWYVWPGFRRRSAGRYGHMVGSSTFVVAD